MSRLEPVATAPPPVDDAVEGDAPDRSLRSRVGRWGLDWWYPVTLVAMTLVLSAAAISGSSLAMWSPDGHPDHDAVIAGYIREVRSDEWLATSPIKIGQAQAGLPSERTFGLGRIDAANSWRPAIPNRSVGAALYSPFNLPLVLLPIEQGFALYWWLPFLACALGAFAWLRLLGAGRGPALVASLLVTTAPAAVWWSGWVCQALASALVPCALLLGAARLWSGRRAWAVTAAVGAGLAAAGLPWFYQPFTVPAAIAVGGVTLVWGLSRAERRGAFLLAAAIAGSLFAVESAVYLLHERSYYEALANTVYPGSRRDTGGGMSIGHLFSSLFPYSLVRGPGIKTGNESELSMGWTLCAPVAVFVAALGFRALRRDRDRALLFGSVGVTLLLLSWCFVQWGHLFGTVTLLAFSPPSRTAPFVGFAGTVSLALLFGTAERRGRVLAALGKRGIALVAAGTMLVTALAARDVRAHILAVSWFQVALLVLAVGIVIASWATRWRRVVVGAAVAFAVVSGALVNPVVHGTGAITGSEAAAKAAAIDRQVVRPVDGNWAAQGISASALLNGQGVNSLSSYNDPVSTKAWRVLDPTKGAEGVWNRLGYVNFKWDPKLTEPVLWNPAADIVEVQINPCDARMAKLNFTAILSPRPVDAPCLRKIDTLRWNGEDLTAYEVVRS